MIYYNIPNFHFLHITSYPSTYLKKKKKLYIYLYMSYISEEVALR